MNIALIAVLTTLITVQDDRVRALERRVAELEQELAEYRKVYPRETLQRDKRAAELRELDRTITKKQTERETLAAEAHTALDRGQDDEAVAKHKRARAIDAEVAPMKTRLEKLASDLVAQAAPLLDHEEPDVREAATVHLKSLGPPAFPALKKARETASAEAAARIDSIVAAAKPKGAHIEPSKKTYAPDEDIEVNVRGLPGSGGDWITLVDATAADDTYAEWHWAGCDGAFTFKGLPAGEYEVRVYFNWPAAGYQVQSRTKIVVK